MNVDKPMETGKEVALKGLLRLLSFSAITTSEGGDLCWWIWWQYN